MFEDNIFRGNLCSSSSLKAYVSLLVVLSSLVCFVQNQIVLPDSYQLRLYDHDGDGSRVYESAGTYEVDSLPCWLSDVGCTSSEARFISDPQSISTKTTALIMDCTSLGLGYNSNRLLCVPLVTSQATQIHKKMFNLPIQRSQPLSAVRAVPLGDIQGQNQVDGVQIRSSQTESIEMAEPSDQPSATYNLQTKRATVVNDYNLATGSDTIRLDQNPPEISPCTGDNNQRRACQLFGSSQVGTLDLASNSRPRRKQSYSQKSIRVSLEDAKRLLESQRLASGLWGLRTSRASLPGYMSISGQADGQAVRSATVGRPQRGNIATTSSALSLINQNGTMVVQQAKQPLMASEDQEPSPNSDMELIQQQLHNQQPQQRPTLGPIVDEKGLATKITPDEGSLDCNKRQFSFTAVKSDANGNKCSGLVVASICYGSCDSGEFADWVFPHKKSIHKICTHGTRKRRKITLDSCTSDSVNPSLREYYYMDAKSCVCKKCTSVDTTCLGSMTRPYLRGSTSKTSGIDEITFIY